ncbi:MAG: GspE/PulE family protein [Pseudomonadota bacterium]
MHTQEAARAEETKDITQILLNEGYITEDQLARAKRIHKKLEVQQRLTKVLVQLGYVYESQIREAMKKHKKHLRIGDFLLEMELIREDDLEKALKIQKAHKAEGKLLGEVLLDQGMISETRLCKALAERFDCPFIEPDLKIIDKSLLDKSIFQHMSRHLFIPFSKSSDGITVIFYDPLNKEAVKAAADIFKQAIIPAIATKEQIVNSLNGLTLAPGKMEKAQISGKDGKDDIVRIVDYLIQSAIDENASDVHLEPLAHKLRIRFRKDGVLLQKTEFPKYLQEMILSRMKVMAGVDIADKRHHQDGKIEYLYYNNKFDIRFSSYVTIFGENIVLRILSMKSGLKDFSELGFAPGTLKKYIEEVLNPTSGVVIITGPTGSGKTTTLYSSINYCNDPSIKIITAEDPVEYIIEGITQCSINPYIGLTYDETLRAIVRQDPDIIVLGEIRDKNSAQVAIQAALTGHKVFSTFHTEDSIGGIIRLMEMDIETFLISSTILSVVAQRLLRKICPACKESYKPNPYELRKVGLNNEELQGYGFFKGAGCKQCNYTGYSGRIGVYELLILNEPVKNAILEKKTSHEIRNVSFESTGLVTLLEDGIIKVLQGITTFDEIRKHIPYTAIPRKLGHILKMVEH